MNREDILRQAEELVNGERARSYGPAYSNFKRIADLWGAYLGVPLKPEDVAILNILLKVARTKGDITHADNFIDIAGYAALGGEIATKE